MVDYVAEFKKVSFDIFNTDFKNINLDIDCDLKKTYEDIIMPSRATKFSAGYDFYSPIDFCLENNQSIFIPTGIRCKMNNDIVLLITPRSSLGFKYRLQIDNTIGIIDSDYYNSDNEGHIKIKITNDSKDLKVLNIKKGDSFCQGIFVKYYLAIEEEITKIRNGGFGSTNEKM